MTYPPAEQRANAKRSSIVVGKTDVRRDAERLDTPNPP